MGNSSPDIISELTGIDYTDSIKTAINRVKNGESFDTAVKGLELSDTAFSSLHKYIDATDEAKLSVDDFAKENESAMKSVASASTNLNTASQSASAFGTVMKTIGGTVLNMAIGAGVGLAITGIITLLDQAIVTGKEANEAMESAFSDYDSAKQDLSNINSQLEQTQSRMSELQSKGTLTFVEQEELEKLKEANSELKLQQDIAEKQVDRAAKDAGDSVLKAYEKNFGDYTLSQKAIDDYIKNQPLSVNELSDSRDLASQIAAIEQAQDALEEAQQSNNQDEIERYSTIIDDTTANIEDQVSLLQEYQSKLREVPDDLRTDDQKKALDEISDSIDFVYKKLDPTKWKEIKFDEIFSSDDFDGLKDQLIAESQEAGKTGISVEGLKSKHADLADAVESAGMSLSDFVGEINAQASAATTSSQSIEDLEEDFSSFQSTAVGMINSVDSLNAVLVNSMSGKGLAFDFDEETGEIISDIDTIAAAFDGLDGYDPSVLFERTANGIHINREALRQLQAQQEANNKQQFIEKQIALQDQLNAAIEKQQQYQKQGDTENADLQQATINSLQSQIDTVKNLAAAYDGATSAYQKWVNAQSNGEEGDMYDSFQTAIERGDELLDQGLVGTNEFRAIADLFAYGDQSTASIDDLVNAYKSAAPEIKRFFTEGQEGAQNFVSYLEDHNFAETFLDENGNENIKFNTGSDEEIAKMLGIDVEAVQAIYRKLSDYGFDVQLGDTSGSENLTAQLEEASKAAEDAKQKLSELQKEGEISTDIKLDVDVSELDSSQIEERISALQELRDNAEIKFGADSSEVEYVEKLLQEAELRKEQLASPTSVNISADQAQNAYSLIEQFNDRLNEINGSSATTNVSVETDSTLDQISQEIAALPEDVRVSIGIDGETPEEIKSQLASNPITIPVQYQKTNSATDTSDSSQEVTVNYKKGSQEDPDDKEAKVNYLRGNQAAPVDRFAKVNYSLGTVAVPKDATVKVNYTLGSVAKPGSASGTVHSPAHANGTLSDLWKNYLSVAYASGDVTIKKDQEALVNEIGMESRVRDGKFELIPGGPHFEQLKRGDIIFNARQTEQLLKYGYTNSRGILAQSSGTLTSAYSAGSGRFYGSSSSSKSSNKSPSSSSSNRTTSQNTSAVQSNTDALKENTEAQKQTFDWIEQMISVQERSYNYFEKAIDDFEQSYSKNKAVDQFTEGAQIYLETLRKAQNTYMSKANNLGLSGNYIHKIWAGEMNIEDITDEDLANKIQQYEEWYEKARDLGEQIEDINRSLREAKISKLDNIKEDYDNLKTYHESVISYNDALNEYKEQLNLVGNEDVLWNNLDHQKQIKTYLQAQQKALEKQLNALVADGTIAEFGATWQEWQGNINEVRQAIIECDSAVLDLKESIREIRLDNFNKMLDTLEFTSDMAQSVRDLMSDADLWDDDVKITDSGLAQLGLMGTELISAKQQVANYNVAIEALAKDLKNGNISQAQYNEQLREYQQSQMDAVAATKDARDAILDLVREGINKETEAMEDLISKRKEALQAQRDADNYAKNVADKQKEINMIQAQINALDGNDSMSAEAERRRLNSQLLELQDELNETMEDHKYDMLQQGYDDGLEAFKENQEETLDALNNSLESQNAAISNMLESAKNNYQIVYDQLQSMASQYGFTLTESLTKPWQSAQAALQQYQESIGKLSGNIRIDTSKIQSSANVNKTAPKAEAPSATTDKSKTGTWLKQDGRWWYQHSDGGWTENAWEKIDGTWYKFDANGWMQTGWQAWGEDSKGRTLWYYLKPSGAMAASEWIEDKGKQYYVDHTGAMVREAYVKSKNKNLYYWVNADGVWEPQWDTANPNLKKYRLAYASGTPYSQSGPALTDEQGLGSEVVITPSGAIRQLQAGSTVLSKSQVDYLYNLSKNATQATKASSGNTAGFLSENTGGDTYEFHIDRMMTIEGDVTKDVFPGVKQMCEMATDYMLQQANKTAKRIGKTRYKR